MQFPKAPLSQDSTCWRITKVEFQESQQILIFLSFFYLRGKFLTTSLTKYSTIQALPSTGFGFFFFKLLNLFFQDISLSAVMGVRVGGHGWGVSYYILYIHYILYNIICIYYICKLDTSPRHFLTEQPMFPGL